MSFTRKGFAKSPLTTRSTSSLWLLLRRMFGHGGVIRFVTQKTAPPQKILVNRIPTDRVEMLGIPTPFPQGFILLFAESLHWVTLGSAHRDVTSLYMVIHFPPHFWGSSGRKF